MNLINGKGSWGSMGLVASPVLQIMKNIFLLYWKNWWFQCWKHQFFTRFFQHWKWNAFSLISPYFSRFFLTNSENTTKSKFRQEMLNILSMLKFTGLRLAFYDWKVSFSLISPISFSLGYKEFYFLWLTTMMFKLVLQPSSNILLNQ